MKIGAHYTPIEGCTFTVWAPFHDKVSVKVLGSEESIHSMERNSQGYWSTTISDLNPYDKYLYLLGDDSTLPDPASFYQGEGVHDPSQIIDHSDYTWHDESWKGIPLAKMIIYELHVGTFTEEGTFDGIISRLKDLLDLGINTIELMPVAQFPGERNWGYDGVFPFAVQNSYGGPNRLKNFVNTCHSLGMSVILDVVYNHLGPEGNYLHAYGPYFTEKYRTPWGKAINFDDVYSDEVRKFFFENALYWFEHYHIDALRLDAVHAIYDDSAKPFLKELKEEVVQWSKEKGKEVYLIAESDLNDIKIIQSPKQAGFGLDGQWSDDFHHSIHTLLTGENQGYYEDFGSIRHLDKALRESFVYDWQYSPYRKRHHGNCAKEVPADKFVVFIQNHDQVGNRMLGDRLSKLTSLEGIKLAAGILFFAPYVPLIFMGEEYGEETPFHYFVSHTDEQLIEAVRKGRKEEFASFKWKGKFFDPQSQETFAKSKIDWPCRTAKHHKVILEYYKNLIMLRKTTLAISDLQRMNIEIVSLTDLNIIYFRRWSVDNEVIVIANFNNKEQSFEMNYPDGKWTKIIDSMDERWSGPGAILENELTFDKKVKLGPLNFASYIKEL